MTQAREDALPKPPCGKDGWPWATEKVRGLREAAVAQWPRISIVVPSFNQGRFVEETLRSVLLQGYPDIELMVCDGGSGDETLEVLRRYSSHLAYWRSEPDRGQSHAINEGLSKASGDLVTFLGTDDIYLPGALADAALRWLERPACGGVVGAFRFMDATSRMADEVFAPRLPRKGPLDLTLAEPGSWRLHQVSTFFSGRALDSVGRYVRDELRFTMDRELLYRICRAFPLVLSPRVYAAFRRHSGSKSVAEILPFSREMGSLHLVNDSVGEASSISRRRRAFANYWFARGHEKMAVATSGVTAAKHLLMALRYRPLLLARRGYWRKWLRLPTPPAGRESPRSSSYERE